MRLPVSWKVRASRSAWMARSGLWTISWLSRLWRSVKYEEVYLKEYPGVKELKKSLKRYFDFYSNEGSHQSFHGMTPADVCNGTPSLQLAA